jgi:hypothetical protein
MPDTALRPKSGPLKLIVKAVVFVMGVVLCVMLAGAALAQAPISNASAPPGQWQPRDGQQLYFDVTRNGERFGWHVVNFHRNGDRLEVKTDVSLTAGLGPLTVFEYKLSVTETYVGAGLQSIVARTKNKGRWRDLRATRETGGLRVAAWKFNGLLTSPVIPSTHWNAAEMRQRAMFSVETGEMLNMTVTDMGMQRIRTGQGEIAARRYRVVSEITADFWYDAAGRWVKCAFTTEGQRVEYVLRAVPA